jgi:hypothetical protein
MTRILAVAALAAALVTGSAGVASADPGGQCDGVVDFMCRGHVCQPDELDCGLVPPCFAWIAGVCLF